MKKKYKVLILCGLPGSGKTWWAKNMSSGEIISPSEYPGKSLEEIFSGRCIYGGGGCTIILDDSYLITSDVIQIIMEVYDLLWKAEIIEIEIHQWEGKREDCLWNSSRWQKSPENKDFILGAPIEKIRLQEIQEKYKEYLNIKIISPLVTHQVHRCTSWERDFGEVDVLRSSRTWRIGEDTPEFTELYEYIKNRYPDYPWYGKILESCAIIQTKEGRDYHGGFWEDAWWECNLEGLYKYMEENGYTD